jgi:hypothetical protein
MKRIKITLTVLVSAAMMAMGTYAQEAISTTGGDASGKGGSVSYTVGQVSYITVTRTGGSIAQGVQQPFDIQLKDAVKGTQGIVLECSAYPNPTTDLLTLKIKDYNMEKLSFQLYNLSGKLLESKEIENEQTTISTASLIPSTYFLKISDRRKEIKTFKIIKK